MDLIPSIIHAQKKKNKNIFFICMIIRNLDKPLDTKFMPDWGAIASTSAISL